MNTNKDSQVIWSFPSFEVTRQAAKITKSIGFFRVCAHFSTGVINQIHWFFQDGISAALRVDYSLKFPTISNAFVIYPPFFGLFPCLSFSTLLLLFAIAFKSIDFSFCFFCTALQPLSGESCNAAFLVSFFPAY